MDIRDFVIPLLLLFCFVLVASSITHGPAQRDSPEVTTQREVIKLRREVNDLTCRLEAMEQIHHKHTRRAPVTHRDRQSKP